MPLTPKKFYQGTLSSTNALLKTIPPGQTAEIKQISLVNRGTVTSYVYLYFVAHLGSATNNNAFLFKFKIEAYEHIEYGTWQIIEPGGSIWGYASGSSVNISISGMLSL
jgi:hypothetical protein